MTKNGIKPGMIVEFSNGDRALVMKMPIALEGMKTIFLMKDGFLKLENYDDFFKIKKNEQLFKQYNISKVYDVSYEYGRGFNNMLDNPGKLIHCSVAEISLEDIAEKFNVPIESLRITK